MIDDDVLDCLKRAFAFGLSCSFFVFTIVIVLSFFLFLIFPYSTQLYIATGKTWQILFTGVSEIWLFSVIYFRAVELPTDYSSCDRLARVWPARGDYDD